MAKIGGTKHVKRIAVPKAIPITDKKEFTWAIKTSPGPHPKKYAIPLGVLLRDVLKVAETASEVRKILWARSVLIDGYVRKDLKFPVGFMDAISMPLADKYYRIVVDHKGRLVPVAITKDQAKSKIAKVVGKNTTRGGKCSLVLHDGRTLLADNHLKVGDSVVISLPEGKLNSPLKLEKGVRCIVREGKHAGSLVHLKEIISRQAGKSAEAVVNKDDKTDEEFTTVARYLVVVDDSFNPKLG